MSHRPQPRYSRRTFLALTGSVAAAAVGTVVARVLGADGGSPGAVAHPTTAGTTGAGARWVPVTATPTPSAKKRPLLIHAAGDTNLDPDYIPAFRTHGYEHAWTGLDGLFQAPNAQHRPEHRQQIGHRGILR